ncbi:MAG: cyclic nucleotide-binding domain-containing protein [Elusimicrobia bacterium]|nr:cyclic nucleotide-binding domain-containing protein [Elusimicrobiota bacterium]
MPKLEQLNIGPSDQKWLLSTLAKIHFFGGMTTGQLEKVIPSFGLFRCGRGHTLFKEGDGGDALFVVYEGEIVIRKKAFLFFSREIACLGPGQIFGEMALWEKAPRLASAVAGKESKIFTLLSQDFEYLLNKNPEFGDVISRISAQRKFGLAHQ